MRGYLRELKADLLVVGHTHRPMCYRCDLGLVINPGSVISRPVVETSRTFAMVDLSDLSATIFELETGKPIDVPSWPETESDS